MQTKVLIKHLLFFCFSLAFLSAFAQEKNDSGQVIDTTNIIICQFPENPQFPGGEEAMFKYLKDHIQYPESTKNPEGLVVFSFIVTKTGEIKDILILKSTEPTFGSTAIQAIKAMPKWIPGKQNGKIEEMRFTLPVRFDNSDPIQIKEKRKEKRKN